MGRPASSDRSGGIASAGVRVLTWNLFHGRAQPPAGRALDREFGALLAGWPWDVALLQEVPAWWPPALAAATGAGQRHVRTSRHELLPIRRFLARRWPDVMKSWGGGANAILVRGRIGAHREHRLRCLPERRMLHAVELPEAGIWVANLHASVRHQADTASEISDARARALEWAAGRPVVLGGDLNLTDPHVPGFLRAASSHVDHVYARGLEVAAPGRTLERALPGSWHPPRLASDHRPLLAELRGP